MALSFTGSCCVHFKPRILFQDQIDRCSVHALYKQFNEDQRAFKAKPDREQYDPTCAWDVQEVEQRADCCPSSPWQRTPLSLGFGKGFSPARTQIPYWQLMRFKDWLMCLFLVVRNCLKSGNLSLVVHLCF